MITRNEPCVECGQPEFHKNHFAFVGNIPISGGHAYEAPPSPAQGTPEPPAWKEQSDNAYCDFIAQMRKPECLGYEQKLKDGTFGKAELDAHTKAGELLGRHRAFAEVSSALSKAQNTTEMYRKALERIAAKNCGISHQGWGGPTCLGVIEHATKHPKKYEANHRQDILNFKHCCDSCFAKSTLESAALAGPQNGQGCEKIETALREILTYFPNVETIEALKTDAGYGYRPCPLVKTPKDSDVIRWLASLPAPPTGDAPTEKNESK